MLRVLCVLMASVPGPQSAQTWDSARVDDGAVLLTVSASSRTSWNVEVLEGPNPGEADTIVSVGSDFGLCGNVSILPEAGGSGMALIAYDRWGSARGLVLGKLRLSAGNGITETIQVVEGQGIYRAEGMAPSYPLGSMQNPPRPGSWDPYFPSPSGEVKLWLNHDLSCPTLVATDAGGTDLLFAGTIMGLDRQFVWVGCLEQREGNLLQNVRFIGEGCDPRYARTGGIHNVVARVYTNVSVKDNGAQKIGPLVWFTSEDLLSWHARGELGPGLGFGEFDILARGEELLVAAVEVSRETREVVGLARYSAQPTEGKARRIGDPVPWRGNDRLRLLANGDVVYPGADGVPRRQSLAPGPSGPR